MRGRTLAVAVAVLAALDSAGAAQPAFRAEAEAVTISVSVTRRNVPVTTLTTSDFRLTDSGVPQSIESFSVEAVPLDVTLFVDTSGSTAGAIERMTENVRRITALLRPADRYRLITIGLRVETTVPWRTGILPDTQRLVPVTGISLVYDALFVAMTHTPQPGRRHLVVALTDGRDCGSVVDGPAVVEAAGYSEAVVHWIPVVAQGTFREGDVAAWCTPLDGGGTDYVGRAAARTGGGTHRSLLGDPTVGLFTRVLDEFRRSYVLHFVPAGVPARGWHPVRVEVAGRRDLTVTVRSGYFAPDRR